MVVDWAGIAAWAGAAVTAGGGWYTRSQARSARQALVETREAKRAAIDQANSARDSADSARVSKDAAVDQARSARESVDLAREAQHRADQPHFEITAEDTAQGATSVPVTIRMLSGPPALGVELQWSSTSRWPVDEQRQRTGLRHGEGLGTYSIVRGGTIPIRAEVPEQARNGTIRIVMNCVDSDDEHRLWPWVQDVEWKRKPDNRVRVFGR